MVLFSFFKNLRSSILFTGLLLTAFSFLISGCYKDDNLDEEAARQKEAFFAQLATDTVAIKQFLANKQITNFKRTNSGIYYIEKVSGPGVQARPGGAVKTDYFVTLMKENLVKGDTLDNSYKTKRPLIFTLGSGSLIYGFEEGVSLMNVGDITQFIIPSGLAYGTAGRGNIPGNAILMFDIELLEAK